MHMPQEAISETERPFYSNLLSEGASRLELVV
jgi:hypothetical protein